MTIKELNNLSKHDTESQFALCCGAKDWVEQMVDARPYKNMNDIIEVAEKILLSMTRESWLEAFDHHPKIGDLDSLREKFQNTASLPISEQQGLSGVSESMLKQLAEGNRLYEDRFGYIFIVCASGKTAEEMLALLNARLGNDPEKELIIAAEEQNKITRLRIEKLIEP